jgi:hypothetical protein
MEFDALLDDDDPIDLPVARRRGRPKGSKTRPFEDRLQSDFGEEPNNTPFVAASELADVLNGVSTQTLCSLFRMGRATVIRRLKDCPVKVTSKNGTRQYDIAVAARYLVDPVVSLEDFLSELKPEQLPERTRESFWNAKRKELLYRRDAGELWPTDSVIEVFAETFKSFRKANQLWADTVEETIGLTDEQRKLVLLLSDRALDEVSKHLNVQALKNATHSYVKELDDEVEGEE